MKKSFLLLPCLLLVLACEKKQSQLAEAVVQKEIAPVKGSFGYDLDFLKKYKDVVVLNDSTGEALLAIVPDYQARVMTSSATGRGGNSYGWINYVLIESMRTQKHISPFGGEDRFWLGPEGGQYAVFFKKGDPFDFDHWQTPAIIDSEPFDLDIVNSTEARFTKSAVVKNYQGYEFKFYITRQIKLLNKKSVEKEFGINTDGLHTVAFQSVNAIFNTGKKEWTRKTGLLSIWILGMYTPTDQTTLIIPYEKSADVAQKVTTNYFGEIPSDRMAKSDSLLLLRGDGKYRGKIGVAPVIAKNVSGSYDAGRHILTLVKFDITKTADYVNSKWEMQKNPYQGDVVNAYNDGPREDGGQLGPFYELESSSRAKELKPGDTLQHRHVTVHLEGNEALLGAVARKTLGVSLSEISQVFKK